MLMDPRWEEPKPNRPQIFPWYVWAGISFFMITFGVLLLIFVGQIVAFGKIL